MYYLSTQGGRAGDAYGFTVSSLCRLKDTKSNIPRLSLIHYIAQVGKLILSNVITGLALMHVQEYLSMCIMSPFMPSK